MDSSISSLQQILLDKDQSPLSLLLTQFERKSLLLEDFVPSIEFKRPYVLVFSKSRNFLFVGAVDRYFLKKSLNMFWKRYFFHPFMTHRTRVNTPKLFNIIHFYRNKGQSTKNAKGCETQKLTSVISDFKNLSFEKTTGSNFWWHIYMLKELILIWLFLC